MLKQDNEEDLSSILFDEKYLNSKNWEEDKKELELRIGQHILSYDPKTKTAILGCGIKIDNGEWDN